MKTEAEQIMDFIKDDANLDQYAENETDLLYVILNMDRALKRQAKEITKLRLSLRRREQES